MSDFSQRFEKIYKIFLERAAKDGLRASKAALAKYLNASSGKLQKWESGSLPQQKDLILLHNTFGLSYTWLVTGEGEPFDAPADSGHAERLAELEAENSDLKKRLEETEAELRESDRLNRQLTTRIFMEGTDNEGSSENTGESRAAGQE